MRVKCETEGECLAVLHIFRGMGYKIHGDRDMKPEDWVQAYFLDNPYIGIDERGDVAGWPGRGSDNILTFSEFIDSLSDLPQKVKLNEQHTAEVSKKGIKVGCQEFPLSVIDDLVNARKKVLGD